MKGETTAENVTAGTNVPNPEAFAKTFGRFERYR